MPSELLPDDPWQQWHRLFGLLLTDHLAGSPFTVELEKDLSQKIQLLDVVIVRRGPGEMTRPLPDGLDDLLAYNLITFKSYQEALNYRKQVSPRGSLLSEDQFRLYAVCARHPRDLFAEATVESLQPGVYTCRRGRDAIRIVVAGELPKKESNALLHLFSAAPDQVKYGAEHYRMHSADATTIVNRLFKKYRREGLTMSYTMQDFRREVAREYLQQLTAKERLEVLDQFSPEQRLAGLSVDQIKAYLQRLDKKSRAPKKKPNGPASS